MILVHGATGHVGSELVTQLAARGERVRAMSRRAQARDAVQGVEWVCADADRPDTLEAAFRGVERVFVMSAEEIVAGQPPKHVPQLVDAAVRAGVTRIVLMSVFSGGSGGDVIASFWQQVEAAVTGSGLAWTLLRPGRFMSNALQWRAMLARADEIHIPFPQRPVASIDPADIAAVASAALTEDGHGARAYQLTGPEALSPAQELAVLGELLGRPLRAIDAPLDAMRAGMARHGMNDAIIDAVLARMQRDEDFGPLPTVQQLLHRPAGTFARWARAHLDQYDVGTR